MLAQHLRVSRTMVHRVWQRHDLQPPRVERFKISNDARFEEKVRDKASAIPLPLHTNQQFLVESGGTLFRFDHRKHDSQGDLP